MSKISFNSIYDGVSLLLHSAYPEARVFGGEVKQGLRDGDFNVILLSAEHTRELGIRARREPYLLIRYYPTDSGGYAECAEIADRLATLLDNIKTPEGDTIHGGVMRWEVVNGVMHFGVTYRHLVFVTDEAPETMETLNVVTDALLADEGGKVLLAGENTLITRETW